LSRLASLLFFIFLHFPSLDLLLESLEACLRSFAFFLKLGFLAGSIVPETDKYDNTKKKGRRLTVDPE
jgi:hypothetical protein